MTVVHVVYAALSYPGSVLNKSGLLSGILVVCMSLGCWHRGFLHCYLVHWYLLVLSDRRVSFSILNACLNLCTIHGVHWLTKSDCLLHVPSLGVSTGCKKHCEADW